MHQYKDLLQVLLTERIKKYRKGCAMTQETMAEHLHISPRSYAYLEKGTYGCSAATLMFFILILPEDEVIQLRMDFRTLVEEDDENGFA